MPDLQPAPQGFRLTQADVYYVLFKHKWAILLCVLGGIAAAAVTYFLWPTVYQSDVRLFIRYIQERTSPTDVSEDARIKSPDQRGETIINTEVEILTSLDLAKQVAEAIGPERILGANAPEASSIAAAGMIRKNLSVEVAGRSSVLRVIVQHPDPALPQTLLAQVVEHYLRRHAEIHRTFGLYDEFLTRETDQLRSSLNQTETELRDALSRVGIFSLDESKRVVAEQIARIHQAIMEADAQLAEQKVFVSEMQNLAPGLPANPDVEPDLPSEALSEYEKLNGLLSLLYNREQELIMHFTAENELVVGVRKRIAENERIKAQLEQQHPRLTALRFPKPGSSDRLSPNSFNLSAETARIRSIESRIQVLQHQLDDLRKQAKVIGGLEPTIIELQRRKELQEAQFRYFSANLEHARIDEALGATRVSNISLVQSPSPPSRQLGKLYKVMLGILLCGSAAGVGGAFAFELFLNNSIKRPADIETALGFPVFFSIPRICLGKGARKPDSLNSPPPALEKETPVVPSDNNARVPGDGPDGPPIYPDGLQIYFAAFRNHLIHNFETRNLAKTPKLIAVTSCGEKAGVSTVAVGMATSLSETGDGNVLLVDMNPEKPTPYYFPRNELKGALDNALEEKQRHNLLVRDHLYMVSHGSAGKKAAPVLPTRFGQLVPKFKASDYDYIIFDLPPINQISVTPQLARHMDMLFLVIESEKTGRDAVKRAAAMLNGSAVNLGLVLNKTRQYLPRWLRQEV